jgi:hypothetical protein
VSSLYRVIFSIELPTYSLKWHHAAIATKGERMATQSVQLWIDPHTHQLTGPDRFRAFTADELAQLVFSRCIICDRFNVDPTVNPTTAPLVSLEPKFILRGGAWKCPGGCDPRPRT